MRGILVADLKGAFEIFLVPQGQGKSVIWVYHKAFLKLCVPLKSVFKVMCPPKKRFRLVSDLFQTLKERERLLIWHQELFFESFLTLQQCSGLYLKI